MSCSRGGGSLHCSRKCPQSPPPGTHTPATCRGAGGNRCARGQHHAPHVGGIHRDVEQCQPTRGPPPRASPPTPAAIVADGPYLYLRAQRGPAGERGYAASGEPGIPVDKPSSTPGVDGHLRGVLRAGGGREREHDPDAELKRAGPQGRGLHPSRRGPGLLASPQTFTVEAWIKSTGRRGRQDRGLREPASEHLAGQPVRPAPLRRIAPATCTSGSGPGQPRPSSPRPR